MEELRGTKRQEKWVQVDFFFYMENSTKKSHANILVSKVKIGHSSKILVCNVLLLNLGFSNCPHMFFVISQNK